MTQALADLEAHGLAIIPDVLAGETLDRTRDALYRAAESDQQRGREQRNPLDYAYDVTNQRVANVLSRDPLFEDLAFHSLAVELVKAVLGWPALLGNISANITGPGGGEIRLHADQLFVSEPWPDRPQGLNVCWCLDEFTEENGATRCVPHSHKLNRPPQAEDADLPTVAIEAPAGSAIVFESRVWHKTGFNRTADQTRAGVFAWYSRNIYRTQENWFLSLKPEIRQFATEEMLVLLGCQTEGFGVMNGASPV
ncbi:MAG: phytanoyl-CoA dioxygenase family protein [Novosphingobium sp.]|nr:phytanoyl-CoA dioxygenase family protein [Novosphingobium sp.]